MTGLTTLVTHFLGAGLVVFPPPLLEDLAKALDDERHFLVVELGGGKTTSPAPRRFATNVVSPVILSLNVLCLVIVTGITTFVANLLGAGFVILPPPLLEDLAEALDDERHLLIVELGGVDGEPT